MREEQSKSEIETGGGDRNIHDMRQKQTRADPTTEGKEQRQGQRWRQTESKILC